jgi:hypothetical protein
MGAARRPRPGRRALHADLTAHLPAGGTGPFRMHNGMTIITEAEIRGHLSYDIEDSSTRVADLRRGIFIVNPRPT